MAFIQSAQGDAWTRAVHALAQLPAEASAEQVDASGDGQGDAGSPGMQALGGGASGHFFVGANVPPQVWPKG